MTPSTGVMDPFFKKTRLAETCYVGPEPEFFIFDEVRYEQTQHRGFYLYYDS